MRSLEFLEPTGLLLLLALVPLIVLYILKIRRERVTIGSTWLWASAHRDLMAKHPFRRLVPELPLLLQILAIVGFAIALARPSLRHGGVDGDRVAVVIDTSASMGARVSKGPARRIDEARSAARVALAGLRPGSEAFIVEASSTARLVGAPSQDIRRLEALIDGLEVHDVEGDLGAAVALAADRLRPLSGKKVVVVVTDGATGGAPLPAAEGVSLRVSQVGDAQDNTAIVRLDVSSGLGSTTRREEVQVFAVLHHFGASERDAYITLTLEGAREPVASRRLLLRPSEPTPVVLSFEPSSSDQGKGFYVQLSPYDALPADDVAFGKVPRGRRMPVTVASDAEASWTRRALESDPQIALQKLTVAQLGAVNVDEDALVVVEGACPAQLPGHDVVVLAPGPGPCLGLEVAPPIAAPRLTSWERGDARLRFLTLDGVHVGHATPLGASSARRALVRSESATLIADASTPGRSATVVGFDVGDSDWPLKASFVLFVRNIVELARFHRAQGAAAPLRTGEALRVSVPEGTEEARITVEGATQLERAVSTKGGFAVIAPIERAGLYRVRWTSPRIGAVLVPANLLSARESDITPRPVEIGTLRGESVAPLKDAHREWASLLALLAALLVAADVLWLTRSPSPGPPRKKQAGP